MEQNLDRTCKVSVLVPVYNEKPYLRQCLNSLAAQTLDDIEFICIDDGSTDGCSEILDAYAARDMRFRVIHKENSGYGASMNIGLRAAKGKYVGIVESDDFADSEMFRSLYQAAEEHQAEVVKSNYWTFDDTKTELFEVLFGHPYGKVLTPVRDEPSLLYATASIWTCLYRKSFLEDKEIWFNETPGASYQDTSFAFLTKACATRFLLVREGYLHYRTDNEGSSVKSKGKIYSIVDEYDAVERYLDAHAMELADELHTYSAELFFRNFGFNEKRIGQESWRAFWEKAYPKLVAAQSRGWFHHDLGRSMENWMFMRRQMYQEEDLLLKGFCVRCQQEPHLYLYGAGQVTKSLLSSFNRYEISVDGILVSCKDENPSSVSDISVYAMDDAPADREHDFVVIAVTPRKPEVQQEIFFQLEQAGYRNVIVLTKELQKALS